MLPAITLLGAAIRLYHLGYKSLWFDEAALYWIAQGTLSDVLAQNAANNSAPPLFAVLLHFVTAIGTSESALRMISLIAGVIAIPVMYAFSRQLLSRNAAYLCTLLIAIAPSQVAYSQQVREYSMTVLLALLMLLFFYRVLRTWRFKDLLFFSVFSALGILTQYGLALLIFSLNVIVAISLAFPAANLRGRSGGRLLAWSLAQLPICAAVAGVYELALKQQMTPGGFGVEYLAQAYWDGSFSSLAILAVKNTWDILTFAYPESLYVLLVYLGWLFFSKQPDSRTPRLMLLIPMLVTFLCACARFYPYHGERQVIFLTPMIYLFGAAGVAYLASRVNKQALILAPVVVILALSGVRATYRYLIYAGPENIKPLAQTMSSLYQPGDRIYIYYYAIPAFRYYDRAHSDQWIYGAQWSDADVNDPEHSGQFRALDAMLSESGRVWMVFSHCWEECQIIQSYVAKQRTFELINRDVDTWLYLAY